MPKKPFQIKLTEAERDRLDKHRAELGLRSQADVIRYWITTPLWNSKQAQPVA